MHSPKLSQLSSRQEIKPNNDNLTYKIIRISLLIWAFLRLIVSLLWTGVLTLTTVGELVSPNAQEPPSRLFFGALAIIIQLVELVMLGTFIVAGFKKSVKHYLIYYRYCIVTLVIYVISVTLCLSLDYETGHFFGDIYIFYSYFDVVGSIQDDKLFFIASIFDVVLEMLLICLINKLITNYQSSDNNYTASAHV